MDFVEICNVYIGKMIITAAKRLLNSDKICRSYSDLNFGVTFLEHSVYISPESPLQNCLKLYNNLKKCQSYAENKSNTFSETWCIN